MGLIMMELAPSTPAAKAAAVPLGRLLTPWGSHRGAYDVNRLVTCAKRAVIIRIGDGRRRRTLVDLENPWPLSWAASKDENLVGVGRARLRLVCVNPS